MSARPLTHLIGAITDRQWLTMRELAAYAKFPSSEAARQYVSRHRAALVVGRIGRKWLVDQRSFDRYVEQHESSRRVRAV